MMAERRPFLPTARKTNWLLIVGFISFGYALYIRYLIIEQARVGIACGADPGTWVCWTRAAAIPLFRNSIFGGVAVGLALLHLLRPSLMLFIPALMASAFGIVLYNSGLSALAITLLVLAFARPQAARG